MCDVTVSPPRPLSLSCLSCLSCLSFSSLLSPLAPSPPRCCSACVSVHPLVLGHLCIASSWHQEPAAYPNPSHPPVTSRRSHAHQPNRDSTGRLHQRGPQPCPAQGASRLAGFGRFSRESSVMTSRAISTLSPGILHTMTA